jgi:hypothetical protein
MDLKFEIVLCSFDCINFALKFVFMKFILFALTVVVLASCGTKVAYTDNLKKEYNLNVDNMKKVQFYTSTTIILEKSESSGSQGTGSGGALVANQSSEQTRVIIPTNTKCIFEKFGDNGEVFIRFEVGAGKTLKYALRPNLSNGKYYLVADWKDPKGGKLEYGNETYYATNNSGNAYLLVVVKKLQKTKRKDRVVKGIKV